MGGWMSTGAIAGLLDAYQKWWVRLAAEFFTGRENQPVVMFVDQSVLQDLADADENGPRSLAGAVNQLVDITVGRSMFSRIEGAEGAWRRGSRDEPPPSLPYLL